MVELIAHEETRRRDNDYDLPWRFSSELHTVSLKQGFPAECERTKLQEKLHVDHRRKVRE